MIWQIAMAVTYLLAGIVTGTLMAIWIDDTGGTVVRWRVVIGGAFWPLFAAFILIRALLDEQSK